MNFLDKLKNDNINDPTKVLTFVEKFNSVISDSLCNKILRDLDSADWRKHTWNNGSDSESAHTKPKDPDVTQLAADPELDSIIKMCIEQYTEKQMEITGYYASWQIDDFSQPRYNKYTAGQNLEVHVDHIHSLFNIENRSRGIPIYSILGLVNDDFSGGEFRICGKILNLSKGDIIIWPSNFLYPHEVLTIQSGQRISFVSWAW